MLRLCLDLQGFEALKRLSATLGLDGAVDEVGRRGALRHRWRGPRGTKQQCEGKQRVTSHGVLPLAFVGGGRPRRGARDAVDMSFVAVGASRVARAALGIPCSRGVIPAMPYRYPKPFFKCVPLGSRD